MIKKPDARFPPQSRQKGFILPQLAMGLIIISMATAYGGYRYWQSTVTQAKDDKAKMIGERLAVINDAVKTYTTTFFTQIQRGQGVTLNNYSINADRLLTPTLADLNGLGFLPSRAAGSVVYNGQAISFNVRLSVNFESGCTIPTCSLLFQVTTAQPLLNTGTNTVDVRRATLAATVASPGNAGISLPSALGGDPNVFVGQGGTMIGRNDSGVAGLVSITNGYDSQGFFEFLRRDGSLPMTGSLNLQDGSGVKHDIINGGNINANNVMASDGVFGRTLSASESVTGRSVSASETVSGRNVNASEGVSGNTVTSASRVTAGEYVQINGVAVMGQRCDARTVGLDFEGKALTCREGFWRTVGSASPKCSAIDIPGYDLNDATTYACPAGYTKMGWDTTGEKWRNSSTPGLTVGHNDHATVFCCEF